MFRLALIILIVPFKLAKMLLITIYVLFRLIIFLIRKKLPAFNNKRWQQAKQAIISRNNQQLNIILAAKKFKLYAYETQLSHIAIEYNCLPCLETLKKFNFDFTKADKNSLTPLMLAVQQGNLALVQFCLKNSNCINATNYYSFTALHFTADINSKGGDAIQAQIAQLLIQQGAELNEFNSAGHTPLTLATENNLTLVAKELIQAKAKDTLGDDVDFTPLMHAVNNSNLELVSLLLQNNNTLDLKDYEADTALHVCAYQEPEMDAIQADIAQLLIHSGAKLNIQNGDGDTPLNLAVQHKLTLVSQALINAGANTNLADYSDITPLMYAVDTDNAKLVKLLLYNNKNINLQDEDGDTALHFAAYHLEERNNRAEIVRLLLAAGANKNIKNKAKLTPLQIAIKEKMHTVIQILKWPKKQLNYS